MQIHESAEDYLEAILKLQEKRGEVRSVEIAEELGVTKPSVSRAMKLLRENGYIEMGAGNAITLLPKGLAVAQSIYSRHKLLTRFFVRLGVNPDTAAEDACKVEHCLSQETFDKIVEHANRLGEQSQSETQ